MDSKRIVGVVMLCAACLFGVLISTAYFSTQEMDEVPYWWKGMRVTGTVMDITKDTIKVKLEDKKEMTFSINPLTKISILGRTSLENGNLVRITYKPLNEKTTPQPARWIKEISKQGDTGENSASPAPTASPGSSESPSQGKSTAAPPGETKETAPGDSSGAAPKATEEEPGDKE
ncbi:MAG: hypothetical protein AB9903_20740 [Vulcanimicrobiota bacterium]